MKKDTIDKYKNNYIKLKELGLGCNTIARKLNISISTSKRLRKELNLDISDRYIYNDPFKNNDIGKIISCIFGDGCLSVCKSGINNYYGRISHIIDNQDYVELKKHILKDYTNDIKKYNTAGTNDILGRIVNIKDTLVLTLKTSPYLTKLYNILYKDGQKVLNEEILNYCDDMFISLLYFDDGSYSESRKTYSIALGLLDLNSCNNLVKWLKDKFDIESTIQTSLGYRKLYIRRKSNEKFKILVSKYLVNSMKYKIDDYKLG